MIAIFAAMMVAAGVANTPMRAWIVVGQSTCIGTDAAGGDASANAYGNKRLGGFYFWPYARMYRTPMVDLTHVNECEPRDYPYNCVAGVDPNYGGPIRGLLDRISASDGNSRMVMLIATPGTAYSPAFAPGGSHAVLTLRAVQIYSAMTDGRGIIEGIMMCHGEANYATAVATYKGYLEEWRSYIETYAQTYLAANRGRPLVMYLNHFSSCGLLGGGYACSSVGPLQAMTQLFQEQPDKFRLVGPTYAYTHIAAQPHMNVSGNKRRGEKNAEAFIWDVANPSSTWKPLYVTNAETVAASQVYRLTYHVPVPPLTNACPGQITDLAASQTGGWTSYEEQPAATYTQINTTSWHICTGSGVPHAACQNTSQVIVVPAVWTGSVVSRILYYATFPVLTNPGPTTGQRGCVADSDPFVSDGIATPNNAIHQGWTIPGG